MSQTPRGGGVYEIGARRMPDVAPPPFRPIQSVLPLKFRDSIRTPPKSNSWEKFFKGKFCEPTPKYLQILFIMRPYLRENVYTPPPILAYFLSKTKKFMNPPQNRKILANLVYNETIFKGKCGHSPILAYFLSKCRPPISEWNSKRPPSPPPQIIWVSSTLPPK